MLGLEGLYERENKIGNLIILAIRPDREIYNKKEHLPDSEVCNPSGPDSKNKGVSSYCYG